MENALIQVHDLTFQPFISKEKIAARVKEMGERITKLYQDKTPIFMSVLNGSFIFTADLMRACNIPCELSFVRLSSYHGTSTTGSVKTILGITDDLEGRHIIIVEDIIDTGTTMKSFLQDIKAKNPASVSLVTLLFKPDALKHDVPMDDIGFEIPNKFVVGYGLDYDEQGRNIDSIYQLVQE